MSRGSLKRFKFTTYWPELTVVLLMILGTASLAIIYGLPVQFPAVTSLSFAGMNYLVPIGTLIGWLGLAFAVRQKQSVGYFLFAFTAYISVIILHFNVKLWMGIVNPKMWDDTYWAIDNALRPVVDGSFAVHHGLTSIFGNIEWLYLFAFLAMFYFSFFLYALRDGVLFRKVVLASLLVHALGAFSYLILPAIGPFLYEAGVNGAEAIKQQHMLSIFLAHSGPDGTGAAWIAKNGAESMFAAAAAMPSLHTATTAVFLYFAWEYARPLTWLYVPLFLFIIIEAVATRWHYIVDVPVGIVLAAICCFIAERVLQSHEIGFSPKAK